MIYKGKKVISIILTVLLLFSTFSFAITAADAEAIAEEKPTVKIVSFMRGEQSDLRSSELLEARVEGYNGNVRELTYKWESTLGTYLYVYNSHNMYNINNTDGEIEIHNTDKSIKPLSNMVNRTYDREFSGVGYAWASVYGASIKGSTSLVGTVKVTVYDKNGNMLCSDSHKGEYSNRKNSGFVMYNLDADMDNVVIGLFEGDKRNVKDLLGESAVVHITCVESTVSNGTVISGSEHIRLTKESGDYYITGTNAGTSTSSDGDAQVDLDIKKGNCKFHNNTAGDAITTVFVFKKPTTDTTTNTLTLTGNLDDRCDYFIDGVEGTRQDDNTIIFKGLSPNTSYTVEVRGEYVDKNGATKYAYAYVYDTTKPVYQATVYTYLDGILTDISDIHGDDVTLYLHEDKVNASYIELIKDGRNKGTYTAAVSNGIYYPWHIEAGDHYHQAREYKLIVENANGELSLHHYSVTYNTNSGAFADGDKIFKDVFSSGASVDAITEAPVREGYIFTGWEYDGKVISSGAEVTSSITAPIVLNAKWEKAINVTINVTINHKVDGGFDSNENKDELVVDFLEQTKDSPAFVETGDRLFFAKEGVTDENGNTKEYKYTADIKGGEILETVYTAIVPTYEGRLESSYFGVSLAKSGYDVGEIKKIKDANGNWIIDIPLVYNPDDFDVEFSVRMDEDVPVELYPDAVIVKIACWDTEKNEWVIITQQRTTDTTVRPGVRVDIDKTTGEGKGSYPVWRHDANGLAYGYRAVVTGFIYKNSTIIVPTEKDHTKEDGNVIVTYTDNNYTAIMGDVSDGKKFSTSLYGAYYNDETGLQKGTLDAVITVEKYNVTFDAQGGTVNGKDKTVAENKYRIPSFADYQPIMGDHNFLGWYTEEGKLATEGELLTEDIVLYAKWDRVLTGELIVDGYYKDDNGDHIVNVADRADRALIELEEITDDGVYNIAGQIVEIEWLVDEHFSVPVSYKFTGLNPDKRYRIDVYLINYDTTYQNSTTIINSNGDIHDDYNADDYEAVYPEGAFITDVNVFLSFAPEVYFQHVEVDSTLVGESFRPADALVEYLGKEAGSDADYGIIIQHKVEPFGVEVGMDKATGHNAFNIYREDGKYGCEVWKKIFNGNLYDYQANLTKLDGTAISEWPVIVSYGDSVRWSPYNQAPTNALKVSIIPRWYYINYDWNDGSGVVESISRGHIWSHKTVIDYTPEKEGYNFVGWFDKDGNEVTEIAADVATDTTLYAKWERLSTPVEPLGIVSYIVEHYKENADGSYSVVADDIEINRGSIGTVVSAQANTYDGFAYNPIISVTSGELKKLNSNEDIVILKLYYDFDLIGDGEVPDGVSDKFQKKVIFRIVNGVWSDGTSTDIIKIVDLKTDGKYDVNGSANIDIPSGMTASDGFSGGEWNTDVPTVVKGTNTEVYTYSFLKNSSLVEIIGVKYIVEHYKADKDGNYSVNPFEREILNGKIGETVSATEKEYEGYKFNSEISVVNGTLTSIASAEDIVVLRLYYDMNTQGDGNDDPDPELPDNPDIPGEPDTPDNPDTPADPEKPNGDGGVSGDANHHIVFGKTDGIGWYKVSQDGGKTYDIVFGNSTYEVPNGTQIIVQVGDLMGDAFTFYVNGQAVKPDENGNLVITVDGYMLIGALGYKVEVPDVEESLNWFQKLIKAIKDFFARLFGKK